MAREYQRGSLDWTSPTAENRHCILKATSTLQLCAPGDTSVPVSQLSTSLPVRAGSSLLPSTDLRMDDHLMMDDLPHSLGPPRPACTQHFPVLSLTLLSCLQSHVSCARGCPPSLGIRVRMAGSVDVVGGGVESRFDVSSL